MKTSFAKRRGRQVFLELKRLTALTAALFAGALALSGCEEDSAAGSPKVNFVYSTSASDGTVSGLLMNQDTGEMSEMKNSPYNGIGANIALIAHPSLTTLIVNDSVNGHFLVKAMNPKTGELTSIPGGDVNVANASPVQLALTPLGNRLYSSNDVAQQLEGYDFDAAERTMTPITAGPEPVGDYPLSLILDATGSFLYWPDAVGQVNSYALNASTGAISPTPGGFIIVGGGATGLSVVAADPLGDYIFFGDTAGNNIYSIELDPGSGDITERDSAPVGSAPTSISVAPGGAFVYVTTLNGVYVFSLNRTSGVFTSVAGSPFAVGAQFTYGAVSPDGKFLLAANVIQFVIEAYEIGADGALGDDPVAVGDVGLQPQYVIVADPAAATP